MNFVRFFFGAMLIGIISLSGVGSVQAQLLDGLRPDHLRLDTEELSWIDRRFSPAELALLDSTRGAAPPALAESVEFINSDPIDWADFRGRVVVIQSWTATSSEGRALPRRVERVLQDFDPNDVVGVFVHTPEGADGASAFAQRLRLTQPALVDPRGVFLDEMGMFRQPVISIVDRSGKIRYAGIALVHLEDAVRRLVREPFDAEAEKPKKMTPRDQRVIAVAGRDTGGGEPRASFPPTDRPERVDGEDLRGKPIQTLIQAERPEGVVPVRPVVGELSGRVVLVAIFKNQNLTRDQITQFNRWSIRMESSLLTVGIIESPVREANAWANSNNVQFALISDSESILSKKVRLTDRDLPYAYIASPDGTVRWQGPLRGVGEALLTRIISASGLSQVVGDARTDPMALPRWRDSVR